MSLDELYGPFASLFDQPGPGVLTLLHLPSPGVQVVLDRIEAALRASDGERWLPALLHSNNWRPHLVGAVALLLEPMLDCDLVWHAIDRGSWVIPQLVVTAAFVDPRFREHARSRVEALCPIIVPSGLTPVERHSATGPESQSDRSTKILASLIAMSRQFSDLAEWRTGVSRCPGRSCHSLPRRAAIVRRIEVVPNASPMVRHGLREGFVWLAALIAGTALANCYSGDNEPVDAHCPVECVVDCAPGATCPALAKCAPPPKYACPPGFKSVASADALGVEPRAAGDEIVASPAQRFDN